MERRRSDGEPRARLMKQFVEATGGADNLRSFRAPGRVNLAGDHTDYHASARNTHEDGQRHSDHPAGCLRPLAAVTIAAEDWPSAAGGREVMWEGTERTVVRASSEAVWGVITDVARHAELAGSAEIEAIRLNGSIAQGSTWEADIRVPGLDDPFVSRSEVLVFDIPTEFCWSSEPRPVIAGEPDSVPEVTWWFRLSEFDEGTVVDHAFRVVEPRVGAEELAEFFERTNRVGSIRAGMRKTLENLKARVEG